MAQRFALPDIGEGLVDAEIVKWHVSVGDTVDLDQVIVEVETAKAVVEIPSPYRGTVLELGGAEGDTIDVGATLIVIGDAAEDAPQPASTSEGIAATVVAATTVEPAARPVEQAAVDKPGEPATGVATGIAHAALAAQGEGTISIPRPKAMPIVRRAARQAGIDLALVPGTGPGGAVTRSDLDRYLEDKAQLAAPERRVAGAPEDERRRLSRTRRTIAEHMSRSWQEIPHVTTFHEVDGTRIFEAKAALEKRLGVAIPIETLVIKAVLPVLVEFPEFNASLDGEELVLHRRYDLGVAVDTPDGLIVPVVRSAESLGVKELAAAVADLAARAKERRLSPEEASGPTFTVTNIGAIGGTHGTPIIPHGTTAILSVGRARPMPVARNGGVVVATMLPLSLSFDHRVIDGALGQRFAARLAENVAEPALFLAG